MSHAPMTHDTIPLQFANQTISIVAPAESEEDVVALLRHHFADCLVQEHSNIAAFFRLEKLPNDVWQLWHDEVLYLESISVLSLLEPLMQIALEQLIVPASDHLVLHAGGVALAEWGVLLCGASGSGKSTLTARLLQHGFLYLSDESLAVDMSLDVVHGFARSLVLKTGSRFIWHGKNVDTDILQLPQGITWVRPTYLDGRVCPHASPQLLLFPRYEPNHELTILPLSSGEAAFALLQTLVNARNLPEEGFRLTAEFARKIPAYRVVYCDETAVSDWIHSQLPER